MGSCTVRDRFVACVPVVAMLVGDGSASLGKEIDCVRRARLCADVIDV